MVKFIYIKLFHQFFTFLNECTGIEWLPSWIDLDYIHLGSKAGLRKVKGFYLKNIEQEIDNYLK